jgi:hypothetical protein
VKDYVRQSKLGSREMFVPLSGGCKSFCVNDLR